MSIRRQRPPGHPPRRLPASVAAAAVACAGFVLGPVGAAAAATDVFVDPAAGCSDAGPGTSDQPFCTISAAAKQASAGQTVHVADGVYPEQVTVPSGVTLVAASHDTVVLGTSSLAGATWTATSGTAWTTPLPLAANPSQVRRGGTLLTKATGPAATTAGSWYWDFTARLLYVDLGGPSPTDADDLSISRTYGFTAANTTGVSLRGFTVSRPNGNGVNLTGSSDATVSDVTATGAGSYGFSDSGGTNNRFTSVTATGNASIGIRLLNTTGDTVDGATASDNGNHGVSAQGGTGAHIRHVTASGNLKPGTRLATGIDISGGSLNAVVEDNTVSGNDDSGIEVYTGSTGAVVRRNLSYDNNDHGIDVSQGSGALVVSNTVVGNASSGINVEGGTSGGSAAAVRDNVVVDNTANTARSHGDIRVDAQSTAGSSIDRDLVFESGGSPYAYEWGGVGYSDLTGLQQGTGQEAHGVQADPRLASLSGRDLRPTAASPAVDAADSGVAGWTDDDRLGNAPVDDPQVADTGAGPTTYADLGALELTDVPPPPPVDNPPSAALAATPGHITAGDSVALDASGSSDDHGITGYVFDCGTGAGPQPKQSDVTTTCKYPTAGTFQASVRVFDAAGQTDAATQQVSVAAPPPPPPSSPPTATLVATPRTVTKGRSATLDASGSRPANGRTLASYRFACGDGSTSGKQSSPTRRCTYKRTGRYTASVTVTDDAGRSSTATTVVTVKAPPSPRARLRLSSSRVHRGKPVRADASASRGTTTYPIRGYRFKCGSQARTSWSSRARHTCRFGARGPASRKVTVWVRNSAGVVATTFKRVRVVR